MTAQLSSHPSVNEWVDRARNLQPETTLTTVQQARIAAAWRAADYWSGLVQQQGHQVLDEIVTELPGYDDEMLRLDRPGYDLLTFTLGEVAMLLTRIDLDEDVFNCRDEESGFNAARAIAEQHPRMLDVRDQNAPLLTKEARKRLTNQAELSVEQRALVPHPDTDFWRLASS